MNIDLQTCPDEDLFVRLQQGSLAGDARARLMAHIDACPACAELLSMLTDLEHSSDFHSEELLPKKALMIGRYEVIEQAGVGGVGVVYKTRDTRLDRLVAVKLLRPDLMAAHPGQSREATQRLQREARTLAGLDHPHIVTIYDVDTHQGQLFTACAFIQGDNLRAWLAAQTRTWQEVVELFLQIAQALAAAHQVGIVHRDVKPENVLIRPDDHALLTDFGMATLPITSSSTRFATDDLETQQGTVLGTPAYMSPEQLDGQSALPASDQFSFCVMLYEALYGFRPYHALDYQELLSALKHGELTRPNSTHVPESLFALLEHGLRPRPADRHQDMATLVARLDAALTTPAAPTRTRRLAAAGLLGVCGVALGLYALLPSSTTSAPEAPQEMTSAPPIAEQSPPPTAQPQLAPLLDEQKTPVPEPPRQTPERASPPLKVASLTTTPPDQRRPTRAPTPPPRKTPATASKPKAAPAAVTPPVSAPPASNIPQTVLDTFDDRRDFMRAVMAFDGNACKRHYDRVVAVMPDWEFAEPDNVFRLRCEYLQGECAHARKFEALLPKQLVPMNSENIARHNLQYAHPSCLKSTDDRIKAAALHVITGCGLSPTSTRCAGHKARLESLVTAHPDSPALEERDVKAAMMNLSTTP